MSIRLTRAITLAACLHLLAPLGVGQRVKPLAPKAGFVRTLDGTKIHYIEAGRGGTALLFVPGWTVPAWIWEKQIAHFAATHRTVAMDPRGQGESSKTSEGLYPAERARDIKAVVDELKLAPVVLVGYSMGAAEVAAYVDQFGTDTLSGLVFVDGWAGRDYDAKTLPQMWQWVPAFQQDRRKFIEEFVHSAYLFKKPQPEPYLERLAQGMLQTPTDTAISIWAGYFVSDFRRALPKIDKPTLIVASKMGPCGDVCEDMQRHICHSQLVIMEDVGHGLIVEDPERFNSLLEKFVNALVAPTRR